MCNVIVCLWCVKEKQTAQSYVCLLSTLPIEFKGADSQKIMHALLAMYPMAVILCALT